jgi:hypothetical protein
MAGGHAAISTIALPILGVEPDRQRETGGVRQQ